MLIGTCQMNGIRGRNVPISVCKPVPTTIPRHFPAAILVPYNSIAVNTSFTSADSTIMLTYKTTKINCYLGAYRPLQQISIRASGKLAVQMWAWKRVSCVLRRACWFCLDSLLADREPPQSVSSPTHSLLQTARHEICLQLITYLYPGLDVPSVLWCCWLGGRMGIQPVKNCLERGANDLHMVQLMPLAPHHLFLQ